MNLHGSPGLGTQKLLKKQKTMTKTPTKNTLVIRFLYNKT